MKTEKIIPVVVGVLLIINYMLAFVAWKGAGITGLVGANVISFLLNVGVFVLLVKKANVQSEHLNILLGNISGMFVSLVTVVAVVGLLGLITVSVLISKDPKLGMKAVNVNGFLIAPLGVGTLLLSAKSLDWFLKNRDRM